MALASWAALSVLVPRGLPWSTLPGLLGALAGARLLRALDGRPGIDVGFPLAGSGPRQCAKGLALGVLVALLAVGLIAAAGGARWRGDAGDLADWVRAGGRTLWLLAIPAAAEEALVRGYPLRAVAEATGPARALAFTSVGFALLHVANPGATPLALINLAAAGLFLGALALRTGSLWWATGAHLGWNWALAFLVDLPVSGLEPVDAPLVSAIQSGPAWLSGGSFGPEGSVGATVALLGAAAWVWRNGRWAGAAGGGILKAETGWTGGTTDRGR